MRIFSIFVLMFVFSFAAFSQSDDCDSAVYQIQQIYENADLNEKAIKRFKEEIDLRSERDEIVKLFKPTKGKHKVILFQSSAYVFDWVLEKKSTFHHMLILKVDKNNEIVDGLSYLLEWAEPPYSYKLARVSKKGVKLKKELQVDQLDFKNFESDAPSKQCGVIDNLYNFREAF